VTSVQPAAFSTVSVITPVVKLSGCVGFIVRVNGSPFSMVSGGISPSKFQLYSVAPGLDGVKTNSGTQMLGWVMLNPAVRRGCIVISS